MGRIKVNDRVEMRGDMFGTDTAGTSLLVPDRTSGTVEKVYGLGRSLTVAFDNGVSIDLAASEVAENNNPDEVIHTTSVWRCRLRNRWHIPVPNRAYCGQVSRGRPAPGSPSCPDCDRILVAAGVTLLDAGND